MCKIVKNIVIALLLGGCLLQASYAADTSFIFKSLEKCSTKGDCSDVVPSINNINSIEPIEVDIMGLDSLVPSKKIINNTSVNTIIEPDLIEEKDNITEKTKIRKINNVLNIEPFNEMPSMLPQDVYTLPDGEIYKQKSAYISSIDPKVTDNAANSSFPGLRGANQLIVYTSDYGLRTGTNEFGAEAVVVKNTVVKLSGADSIIPKEGFVISGHGTAKKWIQDNIILGAKITIDPNTMKITASITPETYIFETNEKIKSTTQVIQYYRMMDKCYEARKASNLINKANDYVKKAEKHPEKTIHYLNLAKESVNNALSYAIPYMQDELKGVWIRPTEHSPKEIAQTVEILKESGINNVFLETFYHGTTIYPSEVLKAYGVISQRGEFNTFDPLQIWINECHKHDIKLHIWFQSFYIGNKPPRSSMKHILSVYPEWANTTKALAESKEIAYSEAEHNGYFIDPANPEVQKFVQELLAEIVEKYEPDGINLDYIRYPLGTYVKSDNSKASEWGYTKYAREDFKSIYGVDPLELKVSDPLKAKWFEYRQQKITDFVEFSRKLTRNNNIILTTVIFTDREKSLLTKMQDWKTWSRRNLVDGFTPLLFTTDTKTAGSIIHEMKKQMSSCTKLYPGIFVMYMNAPTDQLLLQINETRKMHTDGVILFDYAHFAPEYQQALSVRAFNKKFR